MNYCPVSRTPEVVVHSLPITRAILSPLHRTLEERLSRLVAFLTLVHRVVLDGNCVHAESVARDPHLFLDEGPALRELSLLRFR